MWYAKEGVNYNYPQTADQTTQQTAPQNQNYNSNTSLSYSDALKIYKDKRIQFGSNCVPVPYYVVFKVGTKIMLDNRYNQTRPVYLDDYKYTLAPYGFKIVTLTTTAKLPHTMRVDCGTGKNNGSIFLEQ